MSQSTAGTMTQSNAEILGGAYAALAAGDVPAVLAVFSETITWHVSGRNPLSADYNGHDEVLGFFQALGERTHGTFKLDVHDILDNHKDTVVALVTEHGERNGVTLADATVHVWRFQDGKATSFRCFPGDEHAQDTFWS
ncbi:MAG: nuclear transport factor 2 family protein [Actinomycetota bacterium]|nr:nuclear transport factor 2 family protein [Actinomycetota bacterium]